MIHQQDVDKEMRTHSVKELADLVTAQAAEVEDTARALSIARNCECAARNRDEAARTRLSILKQALAAKLDPAMTGPVYIARITHAFDLCEWLCSRHVAWWRAKGASVRVGDIVGFPCDRCGGEP